jgi:TolB-like protein
MRLTRVPLLAVLLAVPALAADAAPATPAAKSDKPRLVVNEFAAQGVTPEQAQAVTDAVSTYLAGRGLFDVLGAREVQTLLGVDRQRQLLGACQSDTVGCSVDLQKLVSARFVLTGQLAKVGSAFQLTLQLVDTERTATAGRSSRLAGTLEEVRALVPYAASEATGAPLPPPPSRVLPFTFIVTGAATLLAGGAVELLALSREAQLNDELCPGGVQINGRCEGVNLRPREFYVAQQQQLVVQKALGVGVMAAGAVLLGLGVFLLPPEDARTRIGARLVPTPNGLAVVGGFW